MMISADSHKVEPAEVELALHLALFRQRGPVGRSYRL